MSLNIKNSILILIFFILQIIWFNHIMLFGKYIPIIYIYPILLLPIEKNDTINLLLAFIYGISIDLASYTGGVFAATAVLVVYLRKIYFLIIKNPSQDLEKIQVSKLSSGQKLIYYLIFILISQFFIYFIEAFGIELVWQKTSVILINSLITLIFFILIDVLFVNRHRQ